MTYASLLEYGEINPLRFVYNEFIRASDMQDLASLHNWMHNNAREKVAHAFDGSVEKWVTSDVGFTVLNDDVNYRDLDTFKLAIRPQRKEIDFLRAAIGSTTGQRYIVCTEVEVDGVGWSVQNSLHGYDPGADNDQVLAVSRNSGICEGQAKAVFYDLVEVFDPTIVQARPFVRSTTGAEVELKSLSMSLAEIVSPYALGDARRAGGDLGIGCIAEGDEILEWSAESPAVRFTGSPGSAPTYAGTIAAGSPPVADFDGSQNMLALANYPSSGNGTVMLAACVFTDNAAGNASGTILEIDSGGTVGLTLSLAAGVLRAEFTNVALVTSTTTAAYPTDFAFHDLLAVFTGTELRLYIDGALVGSIAASGPMFTFGAVNVSMGNGTFGGLDGAIYAPEFISPAIEPTTWIVSRASVIGVEQSFPITDC